MWDSQSRKASRRRTSLQEEQDSDRTGGHSDGWLPQASHLTSQPLGFLFKKGLGWQAEREETEKNKTPGRRFTFNLRQGKYLLIHSWPGSTDGPPFGPPGFILMSGVDPRPEAASV